MDRPAPEENQTHLQRPDWLVGTDEGAAVESARPRKDVSAPPVRMVRPQVEGAASADFGALDLTADPAPKTPVAREALSLASLKSAAPAEATRAQEKKSWTAAASSIPKLRLVKSPYVSMPESAISAKVSPPGGALQRALREGDESFLDDASSSAPPPPRGSGLAIAGAAPARPAAALRESWWVVALDATRTDRRIQLGLCVLIAAVIAVALLQPKEEARLSLRSIHEHPQRFDGHTVTVQGRVGEVFPVGGGYAFHLHQGRDTLVVFTRSRRPESREKVTVKGSISTGFLDGRPRQALFEAL